MALKRKLPRSTTLAGRPFRVSDRDVLPYSWTARDYANMVAGPANLVGATRGHNGGSSIQQYRLVRPPAGVLVLDNFGLRSPSRPGDLLNLDTRLGAALEAEAFVGWGQPNDPNPSSLTAEDWVGVLVPRVVPDPATGATVPADPATFLGGRFVAVVDAELGYYAIEAAGYPGQYAADLAALTPYLPLFDDFHALIINHGADAVLDGRPDLAGFYAAAFAETAAQCESLAGLGFEAIAPDYETILARIRAILKA